MLSVVGREKRPFLVLVNQFVDNLRHHIENIEHNSETFVKNVTLCGFQASSRKFEGCMVDALTLKGDEGRSTSAKSFGELTSKLRSENIRMGKPLVLRTRSVECSADAHLGK